MGCPYKKECATPTHWSRECAGFIKEVCDTEEYIVCTHYAFSLKPQHDERERLYGDPHACEPDWDEYARSRKVVLDEAHRVSWKGGP